MPGWLVSICTVPSVEVALSTTTVSPRLRSACGRSDGGAEVGVGCADGDSRGVGAVDGDDGGVERRWWPSNFRCLDFQNSMPAGKPDEVADVGRLEAADWLRRPASWSLVTQTWVPSERVVQSSSVRSLSMPSGGHCLVRSYWRAEHHYPAGRDETHPNIIGGLLLRPGDRTEAALAPSGRDPWLRLRRRIRRQLWLLLRFGRRVAPEIEGIFAAGTRRVPTPFEPRARRCARDDIAWHRRG